jgi:DUF1680 family protein
MAMELGAKASIEGSKGSSARLSAGLESSVAPAFEWLRLGAVKPKGWIREQMLRDLQQGFAGCLDKLCSQASSDIFVGHRVTSQTQKPSGSTQIAMWWNAETEGNWRAGFIMMAYLTADVKTMREADTYVQHILSSQDADGYLGAYAADTRYAHPGELWAQACLLRGLLDYAELTGRSDVEHAVIRAADLIVLTYGSGTTAFPWGQSHDLMISDVMERLYDLTGDVKYRTFMLRFYELWSARESDADTSLTSLLDRNKSFTQHGAHIYESMRVPLWLWMATGREDLGVATRNALSKLNWYTEVGGSAVSEEFVKDIKPDPQFSEYEYCATKEIQYTLESALQKTGQPELGDRIERIWFNDAQGSRQADGRAITYLSSDNRSRCDGTSADGSKREPRNKFSPTHADVAVCCNPNAANVAPLFVRGMWMRHAEGLVALLYGPCTVSTKVKGSPVQIVQDTLYPFENVVKMEILPERPITFQLLLRNPGWSHDTSVKCEGGQVTQKGEYWAIVKEWKKGDYVEIEFHPRIKEVMAVNGEIALQYGALLFGAQIESKATTIKDYPIPGFEDKYIEPTPGKFMDVAFPAHLRWDAFGFEPQFSMIEANSLHPFDSPLVKLQGNMTRLSDNAEVTVALVPLGNASMLRRVTFPVR